MSGTGVEEIKNTMSVSTRHVSVDAPIDDGENSSLLDVLENREVEKTDEKLIIPFH